MKSKINLDHKCKPNNLMISPFMERALLEISEGAGKNANNQKTISHGLHVLVLRYRKAQGVNTNELYPNINH